MRKKTHKQLLDIFKTMPLDGLVDLATIRAYLGKDAYQAMQNHKDLRLPLQCVKGGYYCVKSEFVEWFKKNRDRLA